MIERQRNERTLMCDQCDDDFETVDEDDFTGMIGRARNAGWTIISNGDGGWVHYCSTCKPVSRLEAQRRLLTR